MPRPPPSPAVDVSASASAATGGRATAAGSKFDFASKLNRERERDAPGPGRTVLGRVNVNAPPQKSPMPAPDGIQKVTSTATASQKSALATAVTASQKTNAANVSANGAVAALQRRAPRPPLTSLNVANSKLKSKLQIPKPAAEPDVFASPKTLGKRAREPQPAASVKRSRADPVKALQYEQEQWLAKWQRAFPTLTFHFEIGADDGAGRGLKARVAKLGARIDQFFSQRISHLIVKTAGSPQKPRATATRRGQSDNPFLDQTGTTDLVQKAEKLGIKVWTVKKLTEMLDQLDPVDVAERDTLSNMLADEKLHGTRERDLTAPRPDYYYFKPGSKYVLIEDATGRHRTVMVKEYTSKEQDWPVLHEQFLRLTSSCTLPSSIRSVDHLHRDLRARAMALYVNQEPYNGEQPPAPTLKRSNSLREFPVAPVPDELPYVKASGNSVVLTSNIASTSTANHNATPGGVGGLLTQPAGKRGAMQVSKRVEVLKRNMPTSKGGFAAAEGRPDSVARLPSLGRRKSTGMDVASGTPHKEFMSQAQVIAMLRRVKAPVDLPKPTYEERVQNREMVDAGHKRKEQDTASGYCENCRLRYTDLSVHMASRKHRRFAQNRKNFADLDDMLHCLQRPPNPIMCVQTKVCRPCTKRHTKDAECGRCMDDPQLYSSPPPSTPGSASKQHGMYVLNEDDEMSDELSEAEAEGEEEMGEDDVLSVAEADNDEAAEAADRIDED